MRAPRVGGDAEVTMTDAPESSGISIQKSEIATATPALERWEDLLPADGAVGESDLYARLSPDRLADLAMLARMVRLLQEGKADAGGDMARRAEQVREAFARDGLDADWLLSQREFVRQDRIRRLRNPAAEGQTVRLLGMVAPLSQDDAGVNDFLLTATLGKCSHVPPPPFHQVAQVRATEPIDVTALTKEQGASDPWVWVEGTIRYGVSSHLVYRGDGMLRVEAAYSIEPLRIISASAAELARQAERSRQQAEALLFPSLTDLVTRA